MTRYKMPPRFLSCSVCLLLVLVLCPGNPAFPHANPGFGQAVTDVEGQVPSIMGFNDLPPVDRVPVQGTFTENLGQLPDPDIILYSYDATGGIAFMPSSVVLTRTSPVEENGDAPTSDGTRVIQGHNIVITFPGSHVVRPRGADPEGGQMNFILGNDPEGWVSGARGYRTVIYEDIYEGIDLRYGTVDGMLKYEFVLEPGADPSDIVVSVEGLDSLSLDTGGSLSMSTPLGPFIDRDLRVFYGDDPGSELQASFRLLSPSSYTFTLPDRDPGRTVVIDPLMEGTYFGSREYDVIGSVAVDSAGNTVVAGYTTSTTFPTTVGAFQETTGGSQDIFIAKLTGDCSDVIFSTLIGGSGREIYPHLVMASDGDIVVTGRTESDDFPITNGSFQTSRSGNTESFVLRLAGDGGSLESSTYIGGIGIDYPTDVDVDGDGNVYITGICDGGDFPTTNGSLFNESPYDRDAYITKFFPDLSTLVYSTYLNGVDEGTSVNAEGIAVTSTGEAVVVGWTSSNQFPTTGGVHKTTKTGADIDAFAAKLSADGSSLVLCTYLGGASDDKALGVALDPSGPVVVVGETDGGFPTTREAFKQAYGGGTDGFVAILSSDWSILTYSSYAGGNAVDDVVTAAFDAAGRVYIAGTSRSDDILTTETALQHTISGLTDSFITVIGPGGGRVLYSSYLGGGYNDEIADIHVEPDGTLAITGRTDSADFPVSADAYQPRTNRNYVPDGFVMRSSEVIPPIAVAGDDVVIDQHEAVQFNGTGSTDNSALETWNWTFTYSGETMVLEGAVTEFLFHDAGTYRVVLNVSDASANWAVDALTVTVRDITPPSADAGEDLVVDQGTIVEFNGAGSLDNVGITGWSWAFVYDGGVVTLEEVAPSFTFTLVGMYSVTLNVTDAAGLWSVATMNVTVLDTTPPTVDAGPDQVVDQHAVVMLNGNGSVDNVGIVNWSWEFRYDGRDVTLYGEGSCSPSRGSSP